MGERERAVTDVARTLRGGRGTLVLGGAGVGKTHLAARAVEASALPVPGADRIAPHLTARATAPYEGIAQLLGSDRSPRSDAAAGHALRDRLAVEGNGRAPLLRIEDVHLLDRQSGEVIAGLARRGELVLLATARPVAGAMSPWHELWRDDVVDRLDVHDLSAGDAGLMLVSLLGGPVHRDSVEILWNETSGNPFHLRELVADQQAAGTLVQRAGEWVLTSPPAVGQRRLDATREELHGLSEDGVLALQTLSLLGPLQLSWVLDAVGRAPVEEVLRRGLVRTTSPRELPDVMVEMSHRLLAHAVRSDIPPEVRRDILEQAAAPQAHLALAPQTVLLMLDDGVRIPAATVRSAVAEALARQRPQDAVSIVDAALAATGLTDLDDVATAGLMTARAQAHERLQRPLAALADLEDALPRLRRATGAAHDGELPRLVVTATKLRADLARRQSEADGDAGVDIALAVLSDGVSWLGALTEQPDRARRELELEVARLTLLGYAGRHQRAQRESVGLLDNSPDAQLTLPLVCPTGLGLLQAGRFEDARRIVTRYRPWASRDVARDAASEIAVVAFFAQLWSGEIANLDGPASSALDVPYGTIPWAGSRVSRGLVAAANGAWSPARRELHAANASAAAQGRHAAARYGLAVEALAAAACGQGADARALLAELDALPTDATAVLDGEIRLLRLDTLVWLREPNALATARALAEGARVDGLTRIELEALHRVLVVRRWTDLAPEPVVLARIEQLRPRVRSARATALVKHAYALQHEDVDLIEIAERELNRRGLWLPPGRQALALTHREREIAALARARLTSRVIAARLGLSARTVDSHLASVFSKLGVSSREDLSHALT
ncbi:LuxR family transcriptional regulator [Pseudactinotalea suaedae]